MVAVIVVGNDIHNLEQVRDGAKRWLDPYAAEKMEELLNRAGDVNAN